MSNNNNSLNSTLSTILGTTLVVGALSSMGWYYYFTTKDKTTDRHEQSRRSTISNVHSGQERTIKPPFPPEIRQMLSKCRLAYLSTVDADFDSAHLSLMRFTYLHDPVDGEVVIMSTNRHTKKFSMLQRQKGVALLVHDFESGATANGLYSITLNGTCRILPSQSPLAEKYRQAHLEHNPEYPQFIVGKDIEILCVDVTSARICDIQDKVVQWNAQPTANANGHEEKPKPVTTTTTSTPPKASVVRNRELVSISYSDLKTLFGEGSAIRYGDDDDNDLSNRPQYVVLQQSLPISERLLLTRLLNNLQNAFGPEGLGFLEVTNMPSSKVKLRNSLLPLAEKLAKLPADELKALEQPDQGWTIGWSHGKEHFKDGTYDMAKGSFYMNPFATNSNVYPTSLQPHLEEQLMTMTRFMSKIGMWIATLCDLYIQREASKEQLSSTTDEVISIDDAWIISKSLASGQASAKARLLYYFPKTTPAHELSSHNNHNEMPVFDDWCGQHKDHGTITALLPGMLCHNGATASLGTKQSSATNTSNSAKDPHPPGLYIETRQKELVHANMAPTSLGFQLGETLQIMSQGKFRATPHSVKAPTSDEAKALGRASLAVFLQPPLDQVLPPLPPSDEMQNGGENEDDVFSLRHRWRSTFGDFQKATTVTFN
jgi:isopenicillin N synthase-like dioxygenase